MPCCSRIVSCIIMRVIYLKSSFQYRSNGILYDIIEAIQSIVFLLWTRSFNFDFFFEKAGVLNFWLCVYISDASFTPGNLRHPRNMHVVTNAYFMGTDISQWHTHISWQTRMSCNTTFNPYNVSTSILECVNVSTSILVLYIVLNNKGLFMADSDFLFWKLCTKLS